MLALVENRLVTVLGHYVILIILSLLASCSFHSTQLSFFQEMLGDSERVNDSAYYWILRLPGESLKTFPIIHKGQLFFTDGENYLVKMGADAIEEIKALKSKRGQNFQFIAGFIADSQFNPSKEGLTQASIGNNAAYSFGVAEHYSGSLRVSGSDLPEELYACTAWAYLVLENALARECTSHKSRKFTYRHELDERGVIKNFDVKLDGKSLFNIRRTGELVEFR